MEEQEIQINGAKPQNFLIMKNFCNFFPFMKNVLKVVGKKSPKQHVYMPKLWKNFVMKKWLGKYSYVRVTHPHLFYPAYTAVWAVQV